MATNSTAIWTPTNLSSNTEYNITVKAYDNAGNISKESMATPVKTKSQAIIIPTERDVGKYVSYVPGYKKYTAEQKSTNWTKDQSFSGNNLCFNGKWRIWSVDEDNIFLISEKETTQSLGLKRLSGI